MSSYFNNINNFDDNSSYEYFKQSSLNDQDELSLQLFFSNSKNTNPTFENNIISDIVQKNIDNHKITLFHVEKIINKKRGRKSQNAKKRKIHASNSDDNITRKIQNHFLNFLISLINDLATNVYKLKKEYFKKFDYKEKAKISSKYFNDLKNSTIENLIIKLNISEKYKCKNDINIKHLKKLNKFPIFERLFKMNYSYLFRNFYYNNKKPLQEIYSKEKKIYLSDKTKSFDYLVEKNKINAEKLIKIAKNFFINETINE